MELAKATAEIVRAEREYQAAIEERKKAERYEHECWGFVVKARTAGQETYTALLSELDEAIR